MLNIQHHRYRTHRRATNPCRRHGVTVIVVLALLAVATTLFGIWARSAIRQERQLRQREFQVQSYRLADAGIGRAIARLAADSDYTGETWNISAEDLGSRHAARVRITTENVASGDSALVRVTAEHPADAVYQVRHTAEASVPLSQASANAEPINEPSETGDEP